MSTRVRCLVRMHDYAFGCPWFGENDIRQVAYRHCPDCGVVEARFANEGYHEMFRDTFEYYKDLEGSQDAETI